MEWPTATCDVISHLTRKNSFQTISKHTLCVASSLYLLSFLRFASASSSSSTVQPVVPSIGFYPPSEKLTRSNFITWKAQVLSAIKGA